MSVNFGLFSPIVTYLGSLLSAVLLSSVIRWLDYLFNIWTIKAMKICPITQKRMPKWVQNFANYKINPPKLA